MLVRRCRMQHLFSLVFFVLAAFLLQRDVRCAGQNVAQNAGQEKVRPAGVAGSFYPADPTGLTAMMDSMLAKVPAANLDDPIVAVIAPHAGYEYSGPVAAYSYAALKGHS